MAEAGVHRDYISKVLSHTQGGAAATRVYDRHTYDKKKRDPLQRWARRLRAVVEGGTRRVVPSLAELFGPPQLRSLICPNIGPIVSDLGSNRASVRFGARQRYTLRSAPLTTTAPPGHVRRTVRGRSRAPRHLDTVESLNSESEDSEKNLVGVRLLT
jgi:hypothetical protein